jgi:predicted acetyltransferase
MKKILVLIFMVLTHTISAEIIYLNDGSILNGAIINENDSSITVETKYQTRTISRSQIKRILYGERELEEIYVLMKNGDRIHGWQIIQDNEKVVYRKTKDDPEEHIIYKKDIRQMGNEEVLVFNPEVAVYGSWFYFFNTGTSQVESAWALRASLFLDIPIVAHSKLCLDSGYGSGTSESNDLSLTVIPIYLSALYQFDFGAVFAYPKLGAGATVLSFEDKVKDPVQGVVFTSLAGAGLGVPIIRNTLNFRMGLEQISFWGNEGLHTFAGFAGLGYTF